MEAVGVTARFDEEGKATPLSFTWKGQTYPVTSTGRRWQDNEGQHILVMVPGERIYELVFTPPEGRWGLKRVGLDRMAA